MVGPLVRAGHDVGYVTWHLGEVEGNEEFEWGSNGGGVSTGNLASLPVRGANVEGNSITEIELE